MAYTTINKHTDHFNTKLYTGNGSAGNAITGVGFQPDFLWIKNRSQPDWHQLFNAVSGAGYVLYSNQTSAESSASSSFASFDSDGFTVNANDGTNGNGESLVSWNWKAGGSSTTTPSGGTITTTASVNTTAGISIFTYTGNGNAAHLAHGLGVAPKVVLIKGRTNSDNWFMKHPSLASNEYIYLNDTGTVASGANVWSNTNPDATKIYVGTDGGVNANGTNYVGYAFAEKTGYSKFGTYTGNGNADGTFVYTGFKPTWVLTKATSRTGRWRVWDNKRSPINVADERLDPSSSDAENAGSTEAIDMLSNGFKIRTSEGQFNGSGETNIYMAFGQSLVGSNNVPCTAR